jgi:hypothetical protein
MGLILNWIKNIDKDLLIRKTHLETLYTIEYLNKKELSYNEKIANKLNKLTATTSDQLKKLLKSKLIKIKKIVGNIKHYEIDYDFIKKIYYSQINETYKKNNYFKNINLEDIENNAPEIAGISNIARESKIIEKNILLDISIKNYFKIKSIEFIENNKIIEKNIFDLLNKLDIEPKIIRDYTNNNMITSELIINLEKIKNDYNNFGIILIAINSIGIIINIDDKKDMNYLYSINKKIWEENFNYLESKKLIKISKNKNKNWTPWNNIKN